MKTNQKEIDFPTKNFTEYMKCLFEMGIFNVVFPDISLNKEMIDIDCSEHKLELYFANLFRFSSTIGLLDKMKFEFKMEHDFSRKVVFLIDLISIEPENIQLLFKKSEGISLQTMVVWYKICNINNSAKHLAFLKYKPTTNALHLMEQGYQGKKLGAKITELEINNFLQLINKENE